MQQQRIPAGLTALLLTTIAFGAMFGTAAAQPDPEACLAGGEPVGPLPLGPDPEACTEGLPGADPNEVCAVLAPEAEDPTFPGCLEEAGPGGLPGGPDDLCAVLAPEASDPTFPACLEEAGPGGLPGGPDDLCAVLAPDADDPTFPACLEEAGPGGLPGGPDDLCAVLAPEASDPTFPACLEEAAPGGLPEGCDPTAEGFPQPECGLPGDPSALDALCDAEPGDEVPGDETFPDCLPTAPPAGVLGAICDQVGGTQGASDEDFPDCLAGGEADSDGDGVPDDGDNCPDVANPEQTDADGDGVGAACDEDDNDPEVPGSGLPVTPPGGLPEGCDPTAEDFPQEACGLPSDPSALNALCDVDDEEGAPVEDETFPTCLQPEQTPDPQVLLEQVLATLCGLPVIGDTVLVGAGLCAVNAAPVAAAGPDASAFPGDIVSLDGSASSDPDGDAITYSWTQTSGPAVTLDDPSTAAPSFTAPLAQGSVLSFELTVDDGNGATATDSVDISIDNRIPVADAGADDTVLVGDDVLLDGSGSSDGDGDALTYSWAQSSGPAVTLDDASTAAPSFTATVPAGSVLAFSLTVADGHGGTAADEVEIAVAAVPNAAPTADAGANKTVATDAFVILEGGGSDPDGDALSFSWAQTAGDAVALSDPSVASPSFTAPTTPQVLEFALTVSDGELDATDTVRVTVGASQAGVEVNDVDATITSSHALAPAAGSAASGAWTVAVEDANGVQDINNSLLHLSIEGPAGFAASFDPSTDFVDSAVPGESADTVRTWTKTLAFPARIKDGGYVLNASYGEVQPDGGDLTINIANVPPSVDFASGGLIVHTGREGSQATTDPVEIVIDDLNWGAYDGASVTELALLSYAISGNDGQDVSAFSLPADVDLSSDGSAAAKTQSLSISYTGSVSLGTYTVTATVVDDDGASDSLDLFTIEIVALNDGFVLELDDAADGAPGVSLGNVDPRSQADSSDDPLAIKFSGTVDAATLQISLGDFTSSSGSIDASGAAFRLYTDSTLVDAVLTGNLVDGSVVLDFAQPELEGRGAAGTALYVVFEVHVPGGTPGGAYVADLEVVGEGV